MRLMQHPMTPGEHSFLIPEGTGLIEGMLTVPDHRFDQFVALLGHPHSLQGGAMNNKVVTTMARAFKALGIPSIRFNFRGVGQSTGIYDEGLGESEDMLMLARAWQETFPEAKFIFSGFSFGSYVAYRAAAQFAHRLLITIAPPVDRYDYQAFQSNPKPWVIVQGEEDEVVSTELVLEFVEQTMDPTALIRFSGTGHFFHGKLIALKSCLIDAVRNRIECQ